MTTTTHVPNAERVSIDKRILPDASVFFERVYTFLSNLSAPACTPFVKRISQRGGQTRVSISFHWLTRGYVPRPPYATKEIKLTIKITRRRVDGSDVLLGNDTDCGGGGETTVSVICALRERLWIRNRYIRLNDENITRMPR